MVSCAFVDKCYFSTQYDSSDNALDRLGLLSASPHGALPCTEQRWSGKVFCVP